MTKTRPSLTGLQEKTAIEESLRVSPEGDEELQAELLTDCRREVEALTVGICQ